jgi:hypothetical protein
MNVAHAAGLGQCTGAQTMISGQVAEKVGIAGSDHLADLVG